MDAFGVLRDILDDYKSFVHGFLNILDPDVLEKVEQEVSNGLLWPEPWLALNPAFQARRYRQRARRARLAAPGVPGDLPHSNTS